MRVLLDCRMATWTGVGRYSVGLVRALASRGDIEVVLAVAAGEAPPVEDVEQLPAAHGPFGLAGARELGRIARAASPDVTHCLHFPTPSPAPHPLVVTMHDLSPVLLPGVMPSALKRTVYSTLNARAVSVSDRIITDAAFTVAEIERTFPRAVGKVTSIPIAADDFSAGDVGTIPPGLVPAGADYLLSMGNTKPHKDLPTLFSAFERIAARDSEIVLLLVGAGDDAYLDAHVAAACRPRVRFTGRVSDPELRALYGGAAAFAFPSRYEGFGLPPLEAMAFGTPVVVARAASLPEVVGDAALMFDPGDADGLASALQTVLSDADLRQQLVAAGHARASELTWAKTAEQTVAVYRELLSAGPTP